ncbi:MAG: hypothetical protein WCF60_19095 [Anaerobacillus sp.]
MSLLRGTLLSVLVLSFILAVGTAFANGQKDELAYITGEVQKKMIRYKEPQISNEMDHEDERTNENEDTNENAEETTEGTVNKPYYYLVVNKTPYLTDISDWESIEEGENVKIGYESGSVNVVKTIDEK